MTLDIKITGTNKVLKKLRSIKSRMSVKKVRDAVMKGAMMVTRTAKLKAPVDTGRLRASILPSDISKGGGIGDIAIMVSSDKKASIPSAGTSRIHPAVYAPFVEYGTGRMRAQPFLNPAVKAHKNDIAAIVKNAINEILRRA